MIGEELSGIENVYNGTVVGTIYQGLMSVYTVLVENRIHLTVKVQNAGTQRRYHEGAQVKVGWKIENGIVITGDDYD